MAENPMVNYNKINKETASNHFNVRDEYKTNTYEQNVAITLSEQRRFSVGCINITGELNIGMIQHLRDALVGIHAGRKRRRVGDFERHEPFPFRLERGDVDDESAPRVRGLAHTHRQHVARDPEVLHRSGERERIGRDDADVGLEVHERPGVEVLRVDHRAVDVGEHLELVGHADVVAVRREPVRDHAGTDLAVLERLDHPVLERHLLDPAVRFNRRHGLRSPV